MLAILALEEHCPNALNADHRPVSKLDSAHNLVVDAGECSPAPSHVIRGAGVQHPPAGFLLHIFSA
jgi:hypothetical protein